MVAVAVARTELTANDLRREAGRTRDGNPTHQLTHHQEWDDGEHRHITANSLKGREWLKHWGRQQKSRAFKRGFFD